MTYETKVLPFVEAVELETKQNLERDVRNGLETVVTAELREIYLEEAELLMLQFGEGYEPEYPDHFFVKVET